jgi:hypothetical protein
VNFLNLLIFRTRELEKIGKMHGTDKATRLGYVKTYERLFRGIRKDKLKLLEIGVGDTGASHKMWKDYFPNGEIYCMDLFHLETQKSLQKELQDYGVHTFKGNQLSRHDLNSLVDSIGRDFDIILDDGAHLWDAIQLSLGLLFPVLKPGGFYIVEDCRTATRRGRDLDKVNANLAAFNINERHCPEFHLKESLVHSENTNVWKSSVLKEKEKKYLAKNIATWEFSEDKRLCVVRKKAIRA